MEYFREFSEMFLQSSAEHVPTSVQEKEDVILFDICPIGFCSMKLTKLILFLLLK